MCLKGRRGEEFMPSFLYATNKRGLLGICSALKSPWIPGTHVGYQQNRQSSLVVMQRRAGAGTLPDAHLQRGSLFRAFPNIPGESVLPSVRKGSVARGLQLAACGAWTPPSPFLPHPLHLSDVSLLPLLQIITFQCLWPERKFQNRVLTSSTEITELFVCRSLVGRESCAWKTLIIIPRMTKT